MKYFTLDEFKCKHCGKVEMNPDFLRRLDAARGATNIPFVINSGYRCPIHNASVKGGDAHPAGVAADILCPEGPKRLKILLALLAAGFRRIGVDKTFIHVDAFPIDTMHPESIWLY